VQFRLIYHGALPAEGRGTKSRALIKHQIRRELRPQLAELWRTHPFLKQFLKAHMLSQRFNPHVSAPTIEELREKMIETEYDTLTVAQHKAREFAVKGYNFLPLVASALFDGIDTACALDILFLRRDDPGGLVKSGGDIDNRIKVLFDALKMPKSGEFEPSEPPAPDEDPFYCLVQDDGLITEIKVTTDRLLTPLEAGDDVNDVHLIMNVRTILVAGGGSGMASAAFAT
jgi:hypothetical protein